MSRAPDQTLTQIVAALRQSATICVVGHVRPDGDCVGSQLGLGMALRNAGKTVTIWNEDPMPRKLAFLDPDGLFQRPQPGMEFECVVATDAATLEDRGATAACIGARKMLINIDHHESNSRYGDLNWVEPDFPSTGELVFQLLRRARWPGTAPIADCLFTAISTDTGSFCYPSTKPETFRVCGGPRRVRRRTGQGAPACVRLAPDVAVPAAPACLPPVPPDPR